MIGRIEVVVLVVSVLTIGCTEHDTRISQTEVLRSLTHAHPGLVPAGVDAAEFYRPWRKSWSVNSNVEMTLFGPPDSVDDGHRIVLFKNEESESPIGLVFPSNASTDYWKFEFDTVVGPIRDTTCFDEQLMAVAKVLGKAEHKSDFRLFIFDLFRGLLMMDMVQASDSTIGLIMTNTPGLGNDDKNTSWLRRDSIWKALTDTTYGVGLPPQPYAFIDRGANRIFLIDPNDMYGKGVPQGKIRVFRTGMNVIPLEL